MPSFRIIAGNFGVGQFAYAQIGSPYKDKQGLLLPVPGDISKDELIRKEQIAMLDIVTEQSLAKLPPAIEIAAAHVEDGKASEVLFVCLLGDGRNFLARCEATTFSKLQAFAGTLPAAEPIPTDTEIFPDPEPLPGPSGQVAAPPLSQPDPPSSKNVPAPAPCLEGRHDACEASDCSCACHAQKTNSSGSNRKPTIYLVVATLAILGVGFFASRPAGKTGPNSTAQKAASNEAMVSDQNAADGSELNAQGLRFATRRALDEIRATAKGTGSSLSINETLSMMHAEMVVSAEQYDADYDADEAAADSKYARKKLLVRGTVVKINKATEGTSFLELRGATQAKVVTAWMNDSTMGWVETIRQREAVLLVCDPSQRVLSVASIAHCEGLDDYLNRVQPMIAFDVRNALKGKLAVNRNFAQTIAWAYGVGSLITADSPCSVDPNGSACMDYQANAAFRAKVQAKSNATLPSMQIQ